VNRICDLLPLFDLRIVPDTGYIAWTVSTIDCRYNAQSRLTISCGPLVDEGAFSDQKCTGDDASLLVVWLHALGHRNVVCSE